MFYGQNLKPKFNTIGLKEESPFLILSYRIPRARLEIII